LRVNLSDIREEGLELSCGETPEELDLEYPDTGFDGKIRTTVRLTRLGENVMVTGEAEAGLVLECARCLQSFSVPLNLEINALFVPDTPVSGKGTERDEGLPEDEMEYHYSGKSIDMGELVREQILLAMPMVPVCKPGCRGLCSGCGKNLNLEECVCHTEERNGSSQA
jgi:DUF177 domain-containing protein